MLGNALVVLTTALSLLVADIIFPGVNLANFPAALIAGVVIGLVNAVVKPVIFILSLPINIITLGAFSLVVNGLCFWLSSLIVPGFQVSGFLSFFLAPFLLSFVNTFLLRYFEEKFPNAMSENPSE